MPLFPANTIRRQEDVKFVPVQTRPKNSSVAVIIPALNEEKTISAVIKRIPKSLPKIEDIKIIVIDDGSTDQTAAICRGQGAVVISHQANQGVGAAFQTGIRTALNLGADLIVNIDADGQFEPEDIPKLIEPIQKGRVDFVTATRFAKSDLVPHMPLIKKWGNYFMVMLINLITRKKFTDVSCGFRAYSREAALRLTLFGKFTYTQETFIDLAFKNIAMTEVPLKVRGEREYGKSRVASNLWRYGLKSATIIFRAARDYKPQYFIGFPGLIIFMAGIAGGAFLAYHLYQTGQTAPYRSLVTVSGVLIIVGILMFFLSMLADMLHRNRIIIEEATYLARKLAYREHPDRHV